MRLRSIESGAEVEISSTPFTTARLLVGEFGVAEKALKDGIRQIMGGGWFKPSPRILMHQVEMAEGGLCEVERKILQELALGAGAMKVELWSGADPTDAEVKAKFDGK